MVFWVRFRTDRAGLIVVTTIGLMSLFRLFLYASFVANFS